MIEEQDTDPLIEQPQNNAEAEALNSWTTWLNQAVEAGSDLAHLLRLEIRLALGDLRRMFFLALIALPMILITWVSLVCLIAWEISQFFQSVSAGLLMFLGIQIVALLMIRFAWTRYKRSLKLPLTRQHLQAFMGGIQDEAQKADR